MRDHFCHQMTAHLATASFICPMSPAFKKMESITALNAAVVFKGSSIAHGAGSTAPSLRDAWFDELDPLGLEPEGDLPAPLRSDAWWRKPT